MRDINSRRVQSSLGEVKKKTLMQVKQIRQLQSQSWKEREGTYIYNVDEQCIINSHSTGARDLWQ